jgi:hypothetical protein
MEFSPPRSRVLSPSQIAADEIDVKLQNLLSPTRYAHAPRWANGLLGLALETACRGTQPEHQASL